jgi:hypothetical protein
MELEKIELCTALGPRLLPKLSITTHSNFDRSARGVDSTSWCFLRKNGHLSRLPLQLESAAQKLLYEKGSTVRSKGTTSVLGNVCGDLLNSQEGGCRCVDCVRLCWPPL